MEVFQDKGHSLGINYRAPQNHSLQELRDFPQNSSCSGLLKSYVTLYTPR